MASRKRELLAGRYELRRNLGAGGHAVVWLAVDHETGDQVAIKLLAEHLKDDADFVARFEREFRHMQALSHPNIIEVFDGGQVDNTHYIAMEYMSGGSLGDLLRDRGRLPWSLVVDLGIQAARGLHHAHSSDPQIIHRDIKPENLLNRGRLVPGQVVLKVGDFGIAKAYGDTTLTSSGKVVGSLAYFSPEQWRGDDLASASDVFSLGVVLYQLLTGQLPFGNSPAEILPRQERGATPPTRLNREVPAWLSSVVMRALDPDRRRRFKAASQLETALAAQKEQTPTRTRSIARPRTAPTRSIPPEDDASEDEKTVVIPGMIEGFFVDLREGAGEALIAAKEMARVVALTVAIPTSVFLALLVVETISALGDSAKKAPSWEALLLAALGVVLLVWIGRPRQRRIESDSGTDDPGMSARIWDQLGVLTTRAFQMAKVGLTVVIVVAAAVVVIAFISTFSSQDSGSKGGGGAGRGKSHPAPAPKSSVPTPVVTPPASTTPPPAPATLPCAGAGARTPATQSDRNNGITHSTGPLVANRLYRARVRNLRDQDWYVFCTSSTTGAHLQLTMTDANDGCLGFNAVVRNSETQPVGKDVYGPDTGTTQRAGFNVKSGQRYFIDVDPGQFWCNGATYEFFVQGPLTNTVPAETGPAP